MIELIQAELVFGTLAMFTVTFIFEIYLSQNIITSEYEETTYMSEYFLFEQSDSIT